MVRCTRSAMGVARVNFRLGRDAQPANSGRKHVSGMDCAPLENFDKGKLPGNGLAARAASSSTDWMTKSVQGGQSTPQTDVSATAQSDAAETSSPPNSTTCGCTSPSAYKQNATARTTPRTEAPANKKANPIVITIRIERRWSINIRWVKIIITLKSSRYAPHPA